MDNIVVYICVVCNLEKIIDNFYKKNRECVQCKLKGVLKRYYDNKDGILEKCRDENAYLKDLDIRRKALEEKFAENKWFCCKRKVFEILKIAQCLSYC